MNPNVLATKLQSVLQKAKDVSDEEKLYRYNGVLYPRLVCPEDHLKALENMEAREDDVMLVAYPKCGFNWMVGVVRKIITEATGMKTESKMPPLIEFFGPDVLEVMRNTPSPRFLGTHLHPDNIPASFHAKKTKIVVIFRNPKDTLVSFYHFSNNNPPDFTTAAPLGLWPNEHRVKLTQQGDCGCFGICLSPSGASKSQRRPVTLRHQDTVPWGSYFDHALAWEERMEDPNVLIVTYEELKQVKQVAEGSTFTAMKESSASSHGTLGNVVFRKGEVGDWRNHFTPEQSKEMDDAFNKHLAGTRLGAKLNYQLHCQ
ncbi:Sulfotransferase 6B1 [Liparis tanakae]|uniref:Sulfotransferase n=1 Tax=Liparis tanakae TaxID=230148 RepID=A0A4Z2I835_9TELE|nr:Sulfotransferase 6B1 [Liparis tanakae]